MKNTIIMIFLSIAAVAICSITVFYDSHAVFQGVKANIDAGSQGVIAYIYRDDLWIKGLSGGDAKKLACGGDIVKPRFSCSGRWLAYRRYSLKRYSLKKSELWLVRSDGTSHTKVAAMGLPGGYAWSPSEDIIAYIAEDDTLHLFDAVKGTDRSLIKFEHDRLFSWSPDGRRLAGELSAVSIGTIIADGTGVKEIYSMGSLSPDGIWPCDWSPDGREILFWIQPGHGLSMMADGVPLKAVSAEGGKPRELISRALIYDDFREYSPDGKYLAITDGANRETWTDKHIAVVEISTGKKSVLTPPGVSAISPAWSPDGKQIAYIEGPDIGAVGGGDEAIAGIGRRRILIVDRDGSNRHQLIKGSAFREERPQWSPDGTFLLFYCINSKDQASLWKSDRDGGSVVPVIEELCDISPGFGYYGYENWDSCLTWWKGRNK
ncbi:MAG: TolB family protein [Vulcanimicrobiota bacterium]